MALFAVALIATLIGAAGCSSSSTTSSASTSGGGSSSAPKLSQSTVTFAGVYATEAMFPFFIAQAKGFFQQQGLTVRFVNSTASSADFAASLAAGAYQLAVVPSGALTLAEEKGAAVKPILGLGYGGVDQLAIRSAVAKSKNIPSSGLTSQVDALKGSHLTIGVSNTTSSTYLNLLSVLKANNVSWSGSSSDVSFQTLGSPTALSAAISAGKIDAIANNPPITTVPNTVTVDFGQVPPVSDTVQWMVGANGAFLSSHPDSIQAFATAYVEGWAYARAHQGQVLSIATPYFQMAGVTSTSEIAMLVKDQLALLTASNSSPAITSAGFAALNEILTAAGTPLKSTYASLVDTSFVNKAITKQKLSAQPGG